jgi:hypothetical protein
MSVPQTIMLGILSSFVASFIFIFSLLFLFKPRIAISDFMCKGYLPQQSDKEYCFVKVVNKSWFNAYEIKAILQKVQVYQTPPVGMTNNRITNLSLVLDNLSHLPPYRPKWWRREAAHAFRFRTTEDVWSIVDNDLESVRIQIIAKHGLTGLTKVFEEQYSHISQIKNGSFTYGTKFGCLESK